VKTSKNQSNQQPAGPDVKFRTCPLWDQSVSEKARENPGLGQKIVEFQKAKTANKLAPFGSKDVPFKHGDLKGFNHTHLTHDLSLIYAMHSSNPTLIDLYGIFSHDELGTGQPINIKRQTSISKKFRNQSFN